MIKSIKSRDVFVGDIYYCLSVDSQGGYVGEIFEPRQLLIKIGDNYLPWSKAEKFYSRDVYVHSKIIDPNEYENDDINLYPAKPTEDKEYFVANLEPVFTSEEYIRVTLDDMERLDEKIQEGVWESGFDDDLIYEK